MAVERALRRIGRDQGIDLFRRETSEFGVDKRPGRRLEPVVDQQQIDSIVGGDVPAAQRAVTAPREVPERAVHCLMRQHELRLRKIDALNVFGIEVKSARVGGDRVAPRGISRYERKVHDERADERLLQNEARARGSELGLYVLEIRHGELRLRS